MARPIITKIAPFDAFNPNGLTINFEYSGKQPYSNKISIYDVDNLTNPLYTDKEPFPSMQKQRTLTRASELYNVKNGKQYAISIILYDNNNVASDESELVQFACYDTPVFYFTDKNNNVITSKSVKAASYNSMIYYDQKQGCALSEFKYYLYDSSNQLVHESQTFYTYDNFEYSVKGLNSGTNYRLICAGITDKKISVTTEITLDVRYAKPKGKYARMYANVKTKTSSSSAFDVCDSSDPNNKVGSDGIVDYYSNVIIIVGDEEDYEFDDSYIILDKKPLVYSKNFNISDDFLIAIKHKYNVGSQLMQLINPITGGVIRLRMVECDDGVYRYLLTAEDGITYVLYSTPFAYNDNIVMTCWIKRINNVYQLYWYMEDDSLYNMWLGLNDPPDQTGKKIELRDVWLDTDNTPTVYISKDVLDINFTNEETKDFEDFDIWVGGE